jgi:hypothetical protein
MNKKKFEDETYIRLKFELSRFLQIKDNRHYLNDILDIINSSDKDISKNRSKMYNILNSIYIKLISTKPRDTDYYNYVIPNKRIPCSLRNTKKISKEKRKEKDNSANVKLSCDDDPHCVNIKGECKLFVNDINLIDKDRKINNYDFYLSKIVDELLRYKLKRNEILNDNIPIIINKQIVTENKSKYVVINTTNMDDIKNIVEKLYLDNNGIIVNTKNLYEDVTTKEIGFKKDKFLITKIKDLEESKTNDLSTFWTKYLGFNFNIKLNISDSLLLLILSILNSTEFKNNRNNKIFDINDIKNILITFINDKKDKSSILNSYAKIKEFKNIPDLDILKETILTDDYKGCEADLNIISNVFNINFIILDKRTKKNESNMKIIKSKNYKSDYFVLLYKTNIVETYIYNLIQSKGRILFRFNQFPPKFIGLVDLKNKNNMNKYKNNNK